VYNSAFAAAAIPTMPRHATYIANSLANTRQGICIFHRYLCVGAKPSTSRPFYFVWGCAGNVAPGLPASRLKTRPQHRKPSDSALPLFRDSLKTREDLLQ